MADFDWGNPAPNNGNNAGGNQPTVLVGELIVTLDDDGNWSGHGGLKEGWGVNVTYLSAYYDNISIVTSGSVAPPELEIGLHKNTTLEVQGNNTYLYSFSDPVVEPPLLGKLLKLSFYDVSQGDNVNPPVDVDPNKIDRNQLITDATLWLPSGNVLTPTEMLQIAELIISSVGDDIKNYPEILCKFLGAVANVNIGKASVDAAGIAKEKLGDHEITYGATIDYVKTWTAFKDNLANICPLFGYKLTKNKSTAKINSGEKYNPLYS